MRVSSRVVGALAFATEDLHASPAGSITLGCGIRTMSKCCATGDDFKWKLARPISFFVSW